LADKLFISKSPDTPISLAGILKSFSSHI
jgi:hypothetical protein